MQKQYELTKSGFIKLCTTAAPLSKLTMPTEKPTQYLKTNTLFIYLTILFLLSRLYNMLAYLFSHIEITVEQFTLTSH